MTQLWGCASLYDCGWTGPQPGRKDGIEFCPNCGGFVAQRGQPHEKKPQPEHDAPGVQVCPKGKGECAEVLPDVRCFDCPSGVQPSHGGTA